LIDLLYFKVAVSSSKKKNKKRDISDIRLFIGVVDHLVESRTAALNNKIKKDESICPFFLSLYIEEETMHDKNFPEKSEMLMKTIEFVDSVLVLKNRGKEVLNRAEEVCFLEKTAVFLLDNIVKGCGSLYEDHTQKFLKIAQKYCIQCILVLIILKNKGSIGPTAHSAISAQVEQISKTIAKTTSKVENPTTNLVGYYQPRRLVVGEEKNRRGEK